MTETDPCPCMGLMCKLLETDLRHGTATGYSNGRCRCEPCRYAWSLYSKDTRVARRAGGLPDGDRRHGTDNGYSNYGCRRTDCAEDGTYGCVQARSDLRRVEAA